MIELDLYSVSKLFKGFVNETHRYNLIAFSIYLLAINKSAIFLAQFCKYICLLYYFFADCERINSTI